MAEPLKIDLSGLESMWSRVVEDHPPCAVCGERIGRDRHAADCGRKDANRADGYGRRADCTCGRDDVPLLLFRGEGRHMESLALHLECASRRMGAK